MLISVIIPIYNEESTIDELCQKITRVLETSNIIFEAILINDGSTDSSGKKLKDYANQDERFKIINLRRNFGQTSAMMAGFDHARGDIIVSMDGDMQNDPEDIPRLIEKILEGYDVCSGWRRNRQDKLLTRVIPSKVANYLISRITGVALHDYGCTLKAYKKEIIEEIKLYGEMHRFIPIFASWQGAGITEIPVSHNQRLHGRSKYGLERTFKVILDLLVIMFFKNISNNPIYVFGGFGFISIILGFLNFLLMIYYKFWGGKSFIQTPLPQLVTLFFLVGFISILMGFIAEILMRTYYESQGKTSYRIKSVHNMEKK